MNAASGRDAFSLLEVLVALVVLEVCLLGVFGLLTLAGREVARAVLLERAAAATAEVADSLTRSLEHESGESLSGEWRVTWKALGESGYALSTRLAAAGADEAVIELWVP